MGLDHHAPPRHTFLDLRAAVALAVDDVTPEIRANGHELTVCLGADPVWISGDMRRLTEVFSSLLRNAVTHTLPSGKLSVFVHVSSGSASVHISDNGLGISRDGLDRIFARQAPDLVDRLPGDLGLAEARHLIEQLDGDLVAHSDGPGHGSRFVVRLPALAAYRSTLRG
jgi:signal transduction histidine kinase